MAIHMAIVVNSQGLGGIEVKNKQAVEKLTAQAGFIPPHTICNPLLPEDSDEEKQEKQT